MISKGLLLGLGALATFALLLCWPPKDGGLADSTALCRFSHFQQKYGKFYASPQEMDYRFGIFLENAALIDAHNTKNSSSYSLEINEFADLTFEEFSSKYLGRPEDLEAAMVPIEQLSQEVSDLGEELEVDWVKAGVVTSVKEQFQCESGYAFAANAALESALALFKGKKYLDLSVQEVLDCSRKYGNEGCWGGWAQHVYAYVKDHGVNLSRDYPYRAKTGECNPEFSGKGPHRVSAFQKVPPGVQNIVEFTRRQPVVVYFFVEKAFQFYKDGIWDSAYCRGGATHAALTVGMKTGIPLPYFVFKNSWSPRWGIAGFFKMSVGKGSGTCDMGGHDKNVVPVL